jgi:ribosomal protein S27AE
MFVKFGDSTPSIEIKSAKKKCPDCGSAIIVANGEETCKCTAKTHSVDEAIDLFTQKIETANNEK